ncbi:hypothetical protein M5D96_005099, partial [Drosophila gunungcola]
MHGYIFFKLIDFAGLAPFFDGGGGGGGGGWTVKGTPASCSSFAPGPCNCVLLFGAFVQQLPFVVNFGAVLLSFVLVLVLVLDLIIPPGDLHFVPCNAASFKSDGINQKQLAQGRLQTLHPDLSAPATEEDVGLLFPHRSAIKSNDAGIVKLRAFRVFYVIKVYTLPLLRYVSYCHF